MAGSRSPLRALFRGDPELAQIKRLFQDRIREVLRARQGSDLDEAAFPAYAHRNPLIDLLVWRKWMLAYALAADVGSGRALDFGCGPGMMTFALARRGFEVTALDVNLAPLRSLSVEFPPGIRFVEGRLDDIESPDSSLDLIVALDVLEHVDDLDRCVARFQRMLRPDGALIVSVPTESRVYALGRRLAGPRFTGDYHLRGLPQVRRAVLREFDITRRYRLVRPVTLFEVFRARPKSPREATTAC